MLVAVGIRFRQVLKTSVKHVYVRTIFIFHAQYSYNIHGVTCSSNAWPKMLWWEAAANSSFYLFIWKRKAEIIKENDNLDTSTPLKKIRNACRFRISLIYCQLVCSASFFQMKNLSKFGPSFGPSGINFIIWQM